MYKNRAHSIMFHKIYINKSYTSINFIIHNINIEELQLLQNEKILKLHIIKNTIKSSSYAPQLATNRPISTFIVNVRFRTVLWTMLLTFLVWLENIFFFFYYFRFYYLNIVVCVILIFYFMFFFCCLRLCSILFTSWCISFLQMYIIFYMHVSTTTTTSTNTTEYWRRKSHIFIIIIMLNGIVYTAYD